MGRFFVRSFCTLIDATSLLSYLCNSLSLNSLNLNSSAVGSSLTANAVLLAALTAAFLVCSFVAAADCSKSNSYNKKHFLHNSINFKALKVLRFRLFAKIECKSTAFFGYMQKKL